MVAHQKRDDILKNPIKKICSQAQQLTAQALRPNPKERYTVAALLRHPWFHTTPSNIQ